MAIEDNASIALIPSGYKSGKLYSVIPDSGNGDFTHSRGSTATRVAASGLIETVASGVPRLDYPLIDGVVQDCPALLLEPSRTNLITYSEDFSQWTPSGITVTDNFAISPDGSVNSSKLTLASGTSVKRLLFPSMPTSSVSRAYSFFVKSDDVSAIQLLHSGDLQGFASFDIENGFTGNTGSKTTSKIEQYPNGWYRCSAIFDSTNVFGSSIYFYVVNDSSENYGGSTSQTGDLFIYGAQYEQGSYPTSYIKTSGSTATRSADVCNGSGTSAEFNDSEGVLFAEIFIEENIEDNVNISISAGVDGENLVKFIYRVTDNYFRAQMFDASQTTTFIAYANYDLGVFNKVLLSYNSSNLKLYINGFEINSITVNGLPTGLSELNFDRSDGVKPFYGKTKQLMTFKTALTDSELETLTSWDSFTAMAKGQLYTIE